MQNLPRLDQKRPKFWKILWKLWHFLITISMENWLFHSFHAIFGEFLPPLRTYITLEEKTRFLQHFFHFGGGGTFPLFLPAYATDIGLTSKMHWIWKPASLHREMHKHRRGPDISMQTFVANICSQHKMFAISLFNGYSTNSYFHS